jgi:lanthanide-dependent methanol dehydrogenase
MTRDSGTPIRGRADNRWTSGVFARDARTGDARWFVSVSPHDLYALGARGSVLLADTQGQGRIATVLRVLSRWTDR